RMPGGTPMAPGDVGAIPWMQRNRPTSGMSLQQAEAGAGINPAAAPAAMVPGGALTPAPAASGGGFGDILGRLVGPAVGFGLEHLLEGMGGAGGAMLGKYAGD